MADEMIYYYPIREDFLDLWNSCNYIGYGKDKNNKIIKYYIKNNKILFRSFKNNNININIEILSLFYKKYDIDFFKIIYIINEVFAKRFNLMEYTIGTFYPDSNILPKLKIQFRNK
jgi:hypothetical protein